MLFPCLLFAGYCEHAAMGIMYLIQISTTNPYTTNGINFTHCYRSPSTDLQISHRFPDGSEIRNTIHVGCCNGHRVRRTILYHICHIPCPIRDPKCSFPGVFTVPNPVPDSRYNANRVPSSPGQRMEAKYCYLFDGWIRAGKYAACLSRSSCYSRKLCVVLKDEIFRVASG